MTIELTLLKLSGIDLIKAISNYNDEEILLIGGCVLAFERIQYLMSCAVAENDLTDAKNLPELLDMKPWNLAQCIKSKFGEDSKAYKTFNDLRRDRNAIVHAYGLPGTEDDKMQRYDIRKGKIKKEIDTVFMISFIDRCFEFSPVYDFKRVLASIRNGVDK